MNKIVVDTSGLSHSEDAVNDLVSGSEMPFLMGFNVCVKWAHGNVRRQHSNALLTLADHPSSADRATWPMKKEYAELHHEAISAIPSDNVTDENCGLDARQLKIIRLALVDDETITTYLSKTLSRIYAFEEMAFFAEGFKRKTQKAIEASESIDQIDAIMTQAAVEMKAAMTQFKQQLAGS